MSAHTVTRPPAVVVAAAALTALVAAAAFAISFASLTFVGRTAGVSEPLSPLYALAVDGLLAVGVLAAVVLRAARLKSRMFVWVLIGAAVAVSVAANVAHAQSAGGNGLAMAAGAVPPLTLAVTLELLVQIIRHHRQPMSPKAPAPKLELAPDAPTAAAPAPVVPPRARPAGKPHGKPAPGKRAEHLTRVRTHLAEHPDANGTSVGALLGKDPSYARSLIREARAAAPASNGARP